MSIGYCKGLLPVLRRKRPALPTAYLEDRPIDLLEDVWASGQDPELEEVFHRELLPELKARGKTMIAILQDGPASALFEPVVYRAPEKAGRSIS